MLADNENMTIFDTDFTISTTTHMFFWNDYVLPCLWIFFPYRLLVGKARLLWPEKYYSRQFITFYGMCNYPFPTRDTPWLAKIKGVKASKQIIKLWDFPIGEKYMYYDFIILPNFSELEVFFMYVSHHHVRSICRFCRTYYYNI